MDEGIDFLDIIVLDQIKEDSTIQSFSPILNSSFFKTAYYFGNLKTKNLVEIKSEIGKSAVLRTNFGNEVLKNAKEISQLPLDELDYTILKIIANVSDYEEIKKQLNVFSTDISMHLYKLLLQNYISYTINELKVNISLTEKGFKLIGFPIKTAKKEEKKEIKMEKIKGEGEELYSEEDITSKLPEGKTEKITKTKMFIEKTSFYLKRYWILLIGLIIVAGIILLILS